MNKLIKAFCLVFVLSITTFTQSVGEYRKGEFRVGLTNRLSDSENRQYIKWL
ncbi:MAG TPA: hypothetical protein VF556_12355 [Pyrinomonadaceae bacterium]|jgi:hypothetical protein